MSLQIEKVTKEGKGHSFLGKHAWKLVEDDMSVWDEETMGENIEILNSYYAVYRFLYRCSCGAEMIAKDVAFI